MKYILIILLAFLLLGCVTQKRCNEKFPSQSFTKDSIVYKDKLVYKDTTIYVPIPGDTVYKDTLVYVDKFTGLVNSKKVYAFTSLAEAIAWVSNSKLYLTLIQKDTTIEVRLDSALKEVTYWKEKYHSSSSVVVKETVKSPWYMKVLSWIGGVCLVVGGLWIYKTKF
jgi:hypothetical protein